MTAAHKFKIGQIVHHRRINHRQEGPRGAYQIISLLPHRANGELEYRIRNLNDGYERDARESELKPRPADKL
jgi:hypothetical protein